LQFFLEKKAGKALIFVEDLKGNYRTKARTTINKISRGHYKQVGHTSPILGLATK